MRKCPHCGYYGFSGYECSKCGYRVIIVRLVNKYKNRKED